MSSSVPDSPNDRLATLIPQAGGGGQEIAIRSPVVHIGQGPQNDVRLDDDTVSTTHARVEYDSGSWRVTDLESRNGTYVEGVRLAPGVTTPLPAGAMLAIGGVKLQFSTQSSADPEAARAGYVAPQQSSRLAERSAFRLPLWLLIALVLIILLLVFLFISYGTGSADPVSVHQLDQPLISVTQPERVAA